MHKKHFLAAVASASAVTFVLSNFKVVRAVGPSMAPGIPEDGALLLIDKLRLLPRARPGDVIVFTQRRMDSVISACKRLVAVEGQSVKGLSMIVPTKHVWVEGDSVAESRDSRHYGAVSSNLVWGRALAVIWPRPSWLSKPIK